ncbi:MAG: hypothetical protein K2M88_07640 [Muribaculaceae bacterium]|nr:hypothetical protein [Muribaculaceae bacterium]
MDEFDDMDTYNDDPIHNMWVDYTTEQYENISVNKSVNHPASRKMQQQRNERNLQAQDIKLGTLLIAIICIVIVVLCWLL